MIDWRWVEVGVQNLNACTWQKDEFLQNDALRSRCSSGHPTIFQGCETSDFNLISDIFFALHETPFSDRLMQFECIEKHIFSGISDYFRLFKYFFYRCSHTPDIYGFDEELTIIFVFIQNCLYKRHV